MSGAGGRLAAVLVGAGVAVAGERLLAGGGERSARWSRTNHRGEPVSLYEGPLLAAGAMAGLALAPGLPSRARFAALAATGTAAALGAYDDQSDVRTPGEPAAKGFRGHLGALRSGRVTSGSAKIIGIGLSGLAAGALLRPGAAGWAERLAAGTVVAGTANLLNLLDLRPGRALKVGLLTGGHLAVRPGPGGAIVAGGVGAAAALLPMDLGERSMLGDCGANAFGALVGCGIAAWAGTPTLYAAAAALVAVTAASERVSFTQVIESTPGLRELDWLGRRQ
jgi:hypothetical protein